MYTYFRKLKKIPLVGLESIIVLKLNMCLGYGPKDTSN